MFRMLSYYKNKVSEKLKKENPFQETSMMFTAGDKW